MTHKKARIAHFNAKIFVLEKKLMDNIDTLTPGEVQAIMSEINTLEHRIECADENIDGRASSLGERQISRVYELNLGL